MKSLHEKRLEKEKIIASLEELFNSIYQVDVALDPRVADLPTEIARLNQPKAPLKWRMASREQLVSAGISLEQAQDLVRHFRAQSNTEKSNSKNLMEWGAPIERIIEYVGAPSSALDLAEGVAVKETIYQYQAGKPLPSGGDESEGCVFESI